MMKSLLLAGLAAVAHSASLPTVCAVYGADPAVDFAFGALARNGTLSQLATLPQSINLIMNGVYAGESGDQFYLSPAESASTDDAIVVSIKFTNTTANVTVNALGAVPGHTGPAAVGDMNLDSTRGQMIGLLFGTESEFEVVADLNPSSGTVTKVWLDFTAQAKTWEYQKQGCSCFVDTAGVYYIVAGVTKAGVTNETIVGMPINGAAFTFTPVTGIDIIGLRWSAHFQSLVLLARDFSTSPETVSWFLVSSAGKLTKIFNYGTGTTYLGMGLAEISADGTTVAAALVTTEGKPLVSYVNLVTAKEQHILLADPRWGIADIAFCSITE